MACFVFDFNVPQGAEGSWCFQRRLFPAPPPRLMDVEFMMLETVFFFVGGNASPFIFSNCDSVLADRSAAL